MIQFLKTIFSIDKIIKKEPVTSIIWLQEVREWFWINKDWNVIAFLTLNWFDEDLASEQEIDNILRKQLDFFDTRINWPISYNVVNSRNNLITHNKIYNNIIWSSLSLSEASRKKLSMMNELNNYNYSEMYNIPEKTYVITLSYKVDLKIEHSISLRNLNSFNFIPQEQWSKIKNILNEKVNQYIQFMNNWTQLWVRRMTEKEIYTYFKNVYWVDKVKTLKEESRILM